MNTFSDEDLKRLKKVMNSQVHLAFEGVQIKTIEALIARLEAAEAFAEMMCLTYGKEAEGTILYDAWRKSRGEGS